MNILILLLLVIGGITKLGNSFSLPVTYVRSSTTWVQVLACLLYILINVLCIACILNTNSLCSFYVHLESIFSVLGTSLELHWMDFYGYLNNSLLTDSPLLALFVNSSSKGILGTLNRTASCSIYITKGFAVGPGSINNQKPDSSLLYVAGYNNPVLKPVTKQQLQAKKSQTSDAVGRFLCPVLSNIPVLVRHPITGLDLSPFNLFLPFQGAPIFNTSADLVGDYTNQRVVMDQVLVQKHALKISPTVWSRQHWSYFSMDPVFLALLLECSYQMDMLYFNNLSDSDKAKYGVMLLITPKQHYDNSTKKYVRGPAQPIWVPKVLFSVFTGLMLSDASIQRTTSGSGTYWFSLTMGPTPMAMDICVFVAALLQISGLGKGYVTLQDAFLPNMGNAEYKPGITNPFNGPLSHKISVMSNGGPIINHLHDYFYATIKAGIKLDNQGATRSNRHKVAHLFPSDWLDPLAIVFLMLGDGDCISRRGSVINVNYPPLNGGQNKSMVIANRVSHHLALQGFVHDLAGFTYDQQLGRIISLISNQMGPRFIPYKDNMRLGSELSQDFSNAIKYAYPYSGLHRLHGSTIQGLVNGPALNLGLMSIPTLTRPNFGQVQGHIAMAIVNDFWVNKLWNDPSWCLNKTLTKAGVGIPNWKLILGMIDDPKSYRSKWHCPLHALNGPEVSWLTSSSVKYV